MYNIGNCTDCTSCGSCQQTHAVDTPLLFCMNCHPSDAPCIKICKQDAFEVLGGAITLNKNKCNKCLECIDVCPFDIIKIKL